jgi:hypothetical protein
LKMRRTEGPKEGEGTVQVFVRMPVKDQDFLVAKEKTLVIKDPDPANRR